MRFAPAIGLALAASVLFTSVPPQAQPAKIGRDPVEDLQMKLAAGDLRLQRQAGPWGYLPSLLKALDVPVESQVLVFSKTSFQAPLITPAAPRAIYFNDDTAVGFVQGSDLIEITTTGADGRIVFYNLDGSAEPAFERDHPACMACHAAAAPGGGLIVANVIPNEDGTPLFITTDRLFDITDSTTPFDRRWGGWYVTGQHGSMRHNGNVRLTEEHPIEPDPVSGQNLTDLSSRLDLRPYPAPTSDIVALMTLEHQLGAMNRIWRLQARGSTNDLEDLVAYLVGAGEAPLSAPVKGVSNFTESFPQRGPHDPKGRSLRDFDLETRLFRYPLSYAVYSRAFDAMDAPLRERVYRRLFDILSGQDASPQFASLPADRRRAALEILAATKPNLPPYWRSPPTRAE